MRAWSVLWWAQSVAVVVYFALFASTTKRLRRAEQRRLVNRVFWLVVAVVWIRIFASLGLGRGFCSSSAYWGAVVLAGAAAAVGILVHAKAWITQRAVHGRGRL